MAASGQHPTLPPPPALPRAWAHLLLLPALPGPCGPAARPRRAAGPPQKPAASGPAPGRRPQGPELHAACLGICAGCVARQCRNCWPLQWLEWLATAAAAALCKARSCNAADSTLRRCSQLAQLAVPIAAGYCWVPLGSTDDQESQHAELCRRPAHRRALPSPQLQCVRACQSWAKLSMRHEHRRGRDSGGGQRHSEKKGRPRRRPAQPCFRIRRPASAGRCAGAAAAMRAGRSGLEPHQARMAPKTALERSRVRRPRPRARSSSCSYAESVCVCMTTVHAALSILALSRAFLRQQGWWGWVVAGRVRRRQGSVQSPSAGETSRQAAGHAPHSGQPSPSSSAP